MENGRKRLSSAFGMLAESVADINSGPAGRVGNPHGQGMSGARGIRRRAASPAVAHRRGARFGIVHTLRVLHAAALSAARCAAGPRTRRDVMIAPPLPTRITRAHYPGGAMGTSRPTAITPGSRPTAITPAHCPWRLATPGGAMLGRRYARGGSPHSRPAPPRYSAAAVPIFTENSCATGLSVGDRGTKSGWQ